MVDTLWSKAAKDKVFGIKLCSTEAGRQRAWTDFLHRGVDIDVDDAFVLCLSPEMQLGVATLLVDTGLELDFALVRVRELIDGYDDVGDDFEFTFRFVCDGW